MKPETRVRIITTMFNDLRQTVENLWSEAAGKYDDFVADWYTHEIERTANAILDFLRTVNKDKV